MQRTEAGAGAPRPRETHDHEVVRAQRPYLPPVGRAPAHVGRVGSLGHHALEAAACDLLVDRFATLLEGDRGAQRAAAREQRLENRLAGRQRKLAQVVRLEGQQVEGEEHHRHLEGAALHVAGIAQLGALLEPLEDGPALGVGRDDLSVQHERPDGQRLEGAHQLGKGVREVATASRAELRVLPVARGEAAVAVVLDLEEPARLRERPGDALGEHGADLPHRHGTLRGTEACHAPPEARDPPGSVAQLLEGEPRQHGLRGEALRVRLFALYRVGVGLLDEQPLLALRPGATAGAHQREGPAQLVALELEEQLPSPEPLVDVLQRRPAPAIPHDHRPGAVVPLGDHALEVRVLDRVVLHVDREALHRRVEGGPLRHRPGEQHVAPLEAEVVVESPGGVLLDDEEARPAGAATHRLRSRARVALAAVGVEVPGRAGRSLLHLSGRGLARPRHGV